MINFLLALSAAVWVIAIAIIAVQNATPVAINFLTFQSVRLPFGVALAFSVAAGMVGVTVVQILWRLTGSPLTRQTTRQDHTFFSKEQQFDDQYIQSPPRQTTYSTSYVDRRNRPTERVDRTEPSRDRDDWGDELSDDW